MDGTLIAALRTEEHAIVAELRGSFAFRRLEEVRRLLDLYEEPPPVGADLDAMLADVPRRIAAPMGVIHLHAENRTAEVA